MRVQYGGDVRIKSTLSGRSVVVVVSLNLSSQPPRSWDRRSRRFASAKAILPRLVRRPSSITSRETSTFDSPAFGRRSQVGLEDRNGVTNFRHTLNNAT